MSPDGGSVYVTNNLDDTVSQYDVGAGGALQPKTPPTVAAGSNPDGVAVSPDGGSVYVANFFDGVSQYDVDAGGALSPKSPATVVAGGGPRWVAVTPSLTQPVRPGRGCGDKNHVHEREADCKRPPR